MGGSSVSLGSIDGSQILDGSGGGLGPGANNIPIVIPTNRVPAQLFGGKWVEMELPGAEASKHPKIEINDDDIPYRKAVPKTGYWGVAREMRRKNNRNRKETEAAAAQGGGGTESSIPVTHIHTPTQRQLKDHGLKVLSSGTSYSTINTTTST